MAYNRSQRGIFERAREKDEREVEQTVSDFQPPEPGGVVGVTAETTTGSAIMMTQEEYQQKPSDDAKWDVENERWVTGREWSLDEKPKLYNIDVTLIFSVDRELTQKDGQNLWSGAVHFVRVKSKTYKRVFKLSSSVASTELALRDCIAKTNSYLKQIGLYPRYVHMMTTILDEIYEPRNVEGP